MACDRFVITAFPRSKHHTPPTAWLSRTHDSLACTNQAGYKLQLYRSKKHATQERAKITDLRRRKGEEAAEFKKGEQFRATEVGRAGRHKNEREG
jgi:hypothetical protein